MWMCRVARADGTDVGELTEPYCAVLETMLHEPQAACVDALSADAAQRHVRRVMNDLDTSLDGLSCRTNNRPPRTSIASHDRVPQPRVRVGARGAWLDTPPSLLSRWSRCALEPYALRKNIAYHVLYPTGSEMRLAVHRYCRQVTSAYHECQLGEHRAASSEAFWPVDAKSASSSVNNHAASSPHANERAQYVAALRATCQRLVEQQRVEPAGVNWCTLFYVVNPFVPPDHDDPSKPATNNSVNDEQRDADDDRGDSVSDDDERQRVQNEAWWLRALADAMSPLYDAGVTNPSLNVAVVYLPLRDVVRAVDLAACVDTTAFDSFQVARRVLLQLPSNTPQQQQQQQQQANAGVQWSGRRLHEPLLTLTPVQQPGADDWHCCYRVDATHVFACVTDVCGTVLETFALPAHSDEARTAALAQLWRCLCEIARVYDSRIDDGLTKANNGAVTAPAVHVCALGDMSLPEQTQWAHILVDAAHSGFASVTLCSIAIDRHMRAPTPQHHGTDIVFGHGSEHGRLPAVAWLVDQLRDDRDCSTALTTRITLLARHHATATTATPAATVHSLLHQLSAQYARLSWLNVTPHTGTRVSVLPLHAAIVARCVALAS